MKLQYQLMVLTVIIAASAVVYADVYGHAPPFSNNRNNEEGTNRDNANRLFNSQNNDKGGYCRGGMFNWYERSILPIEWTNQHGCGNDQTSCNLVLQYMCTPRGDDAGSSLRDGTTTQTSPFTGNPTADLANLETRDTADFKFGLHEPYAHYLNCTLRQRNTGLFIAQQNVQASAANTRQQPNGQNNRHGYECTEERDYYPYWAPSPWKDIAILTDSKSLCKWYKRESQNVKEKHWCEIPNPAGNNLAPYSETKCTEAGGKWMTAPSHDIGAPECIETQWNHVNHLGISLNNGKYNTYNWSLPHAGMEPCIATAGGCRCVLRIRYNISNSEIDGFGFTDSSKNGKNSPISNDPTVSVHGLNLTVELNTAQYGRTFQDRTHSFNIIGRPSDLKKAKIWNLLVKGKRGNIVQTYPAQEYQFAPSQLHMKVNEYIHFQWTGCDTNPNGNTGNGKEQTDRSNIVQVKHLNKNMPFTDDDYSEDNQLFGSEETRKKFAYAGQDPKRCKTYEQLAADNNNNANDIEQDPQNCMRLNAAPQHFDGGVFKMSKTGSYYYVSTRNNNFSNRDQKGAIHVDPLLKVWQIALIAVGATLFVGIAATAGSVFYASKHPHSGAARFFGRVPLIKRAVV
eukprot:gene15084-17858_t